MKLPLSQNSVRFSVAVAVATAGLVVLTALPTTNSIAQHSTAPAWLTSLLLHPASAQEVVETSDVWQRVYKLIPSFPLENQYVNRDTGKVSQNNTLASRLIRYHVYTKGRPPNYRLDWKLTLADYLGVNERISESTYPGADTLRTNPLEGDKAVINRLTRAQRDQLVQVLVSIFTPAAGSTSGQSPANAPTNPANPASPSTRPSTQPANPNSNSDSLFPREPKPGDARLLSP
jgi:hypothetical protein